MVLRQPFVADRSVEPLHADALLWLARLYVFDADPSGVGPVQQRGTDAFNRPPFPR